MILTKIEIKLYTEIIKRLIFEATGIQLFLSLLILTVTKSGKLKEYWKRYSLLKNNV